MTRFPGKTVYLLKFLFDDVTHVKSAYVKSASSVLICKIFDIEEHKHKFFSRPNLVICNPYYITLKKMNMQKFIMLLNCELKKDFPELDFGFYVSRRNRYVHL